MNIYTNSGVGTIHINTILTKTFNSYEYSVFHLKRNPNYNNICKL
jgi:hypothetical protein